MELVNLSCYVGLFFLTFVCFLDFKRNIPKPKPALPFNIALFLFLIANAVVYTGLLPVLAGIELNLTTLTFGWGGGDNLNLFRYRTVSPLLIALLYFGFGKAKLEIGNKEFSFYVGLLSIFRSMFPRSLGVSKKLNEYIEKLGSETNKLYSTIGNIQIIAKTYKWNLFNDEWNEIDRTKSTIEDEIDFLKQIKESLDVDNPGPKDISRARESIAHQIKKSRIRIIEKLRGYLKKIIAENVYHEKSIDELVNLIEVDRSEDIIEKSRSNYIARSFGISFLCGILLTAVLSTKATYTPSEWILYLVTSFFFFLTIFSYIHKIEYTIEGFSFALIVGASGGFIGHLAFNVISQRIDLFHPGTSIPDFCLILINSNLRGIVIGSLSGAIAFVFKHMVNKAIGNILVKYFLISMCGGLAVLGTSFIFSDFSTAQAFTYQTMMRPMLTGCIVLMGISFVSGIFETHKPAKPLTDPAKDGFRAPLEADGEEEQRRFRIAS